MGLAINIKNTEALSRHRHKIRFKSRLLRLYSLLDVEDDRVYTVVLIKLFKLLEPILGTTSTSYLQVYEYEEVKVKIKVALQKAISYLYYNKMESDNTDYMLLSLKAFKEFKAYINNANKHYGVLNKI